MYDIDVFWSGSQFVAYWMAYTTSSFALQKTDYGRDSVETVINGASLAIEPLLVANGRKVLAVWMGGAINQAGGDVFGVFLSDDVTAAVSPAFVISVGTLPQTDPIIASSPAGSLIVWRDQHDDLSADLVAKRLTMNGMVIDSEPIVIARNVALWGSVAVAAAGRAFIVAWDQPEQNGNAVYVRRVGSDGSSGDARRVASGFGVAVASNGSIALTAFNSSGRIVGSRITDTGELGDTTPFLITDRGGAYLTSLASNGFDFVAVWNEGSDYWQFPAPDLVDVYAARVFATGLADAAPIAIATGPANQKGGVVASHGSDYLIVYHVDAVWGQAGSPRIVAKRLLATGHLADRTSSDDGEKIGENALSVALTAAPDGYAIAWEAVDTTSSSLRLTLTDALGKVVESLPTLAANAMSDSMSMTPSITTFASLLRLTYSRTVAADEFGSRRVFFKDIGVAPLRQRAARR